jgi:hypothetical protein
MEKRTVTSVDMTVLGIAITRGTAVHSTGLSIALRRPISSRQ